MTAVIIVIVIIGIILFMGGDIPFLPDMTRSDIELTSNQYHCEEVVWTSTPKIVNNVYTGTMQVSCEFKALAGNGLVHLRKHLHNHLATASEKLHSKPSVESFSGMPSMAYDITTKQTVRGRTIRVRGLAHLATDGFTRLIHSFESTNILASGPANLIRGTSTQIEIEATDRPEWYRFRMRNSNQVKKPMLISEGRFVDLMESKIEAKFEEKAIRMLSSIANQL